MKKNLGLILGLLLIMSSINLAAAEEELLFEGYLNKGDSILVGPLVVVLEDVQKDYNENEYKAMILIIKDNKVLNMDYESIQVPNPDKIQELLTKFQIPTKYKSFSQILLFSMQWPKRLDTTQQIP